MLNLTKVRKYYPEYDQLTLTEKAKLLSVCTTTISRAEDLEEQRKHPERKSAAEYIRQLEADKIRQSREISSLVDSISKLGVSYSTHLENLTQTVEQITANNERREDMSNSKRRRVITGWDETGKAITKQVSGKNQDEQNDAIVRAYVESGRIWEFIPKPVLASSSAAAKQNEPESCRTLFADYANDWFESFAVTTIGTGRKKTERSQLNACIKAFSGQFIETITVRDVQKVLAYWSNEKHYARNTIDANMSVFKRVMNSAVQDGIIRTSPANDGRVKNPAAKKQQNSVPVEEVRKVLNNIGTLDTPEQQLMIGLYISLGVRREELLGARWEHINFAEKTIHIRQGVVYYSGTAEVKDTKTASGNRRIPINDLLFELLSKHRKDSGFIFSNDGGKSPLRNEREYRKILNPLLVRLELDKYDSRAFRRTFATMNIASGVDVKSVQHMMGHATANMTLNVYAQVEPNTVQAQRNTMLNYISAGS